MAAVTFVLLPPLVHFHLQHAARAGRNGSWARQDGHSLHAAEQAFRATALDDALSTATPDVERNRQVSFADDEECPTGR